MSRFDDKKKLYDDINKIMNQNIEKCQKKCVETCNNYYNCTRDLYYPSNMYNKSSVYRLCYNLYGQPKE